MLSIWVSTRSRKPGMRSERVPFLTASLAAQSRVRRADSRSCFSLFPRSSSSVLEQKRSLTRTRALLSAWISIPQGVEAATARAYPLEWELEMWGMLRTAGRTLGSRKGRPEAELMIWRSGARRVAELNVLGDRIEFCPQLTK